MVWLWQAGILSPQSAQGIAGVSDWWAVLKKYTCNNATPPHHAGRRALKTDDRPPKLEQLGLEFDPASGGREHSE